MQLRGGAESPVRGEKNGLVRFRRKPRCRIGRDADPETLKFVQALGMMLKSFLPLDKAPGIRSRASFAAIAMDLGLRGWRKSSCSHQSMERLLLLALEQGPDILGLLVRTAVKRGIRFRRLRENWCLTRWRPDASKQPIWREGLQELLSLMEAARISAGDLDERFLRSLPSRRAWYQELR